VYWRFLLSRTTLIFAGLGCALVSAQTHNGTRAQGGEALGTTQFNFEDIGPPIYQRDRSGVCGQDLIGIPEDMAKKYSSSDVTAFDFITLFIPRLFGGIATGAYWGGSSKPGQIELARDTIVEKAQADLKDKDGKKKVNPIKQAFALGSASDGPGDLTIYGIATRIANNHHSKMSDAEKREYNSLHKDKGRGYPGKLNSTQSERYIFLRSLSKRGVPGSGVVAKEAIKTYVSELIKMQFTKVGLSCNSADGMDWIIENFVTNKLQECLYGMSPADVRALRTLNLFDSSELNDQQNAQRQRLRKLAESAAQTSDDVMACAEDFGDDAPFKVGGITAQLLLGRTLAEKGEKLGLTDRDILIYKSHALTQFGACYNDQVKRGVKISSEEQLRLTQLCVVAALAQTTGRVAHDLASLKLLDRWADSKMTAAESSTFKQSMRDRLRRSGDDSDFRMHMMTQHPATRPIFSQVDQAWEAIKSERSCGIFTPAIVGYASYPSKTMLDEIQTGYFNPGGLGTSAIETDIGNCVLKITQSVTKEAASDVLLTTQEVVDHFRSHDADAYEKKFGGMGAGFSPSRNVAELKARTVDGFLIECNNSLSADARLSNGDDNPEKCEAPVKTFVAFDLFRAKIPWKLDEALDEIYKSVKNPESKSSFKDFDQKKRRILNDSIKKLDECRARALKKPAHELAETDATNCLRELLVYFAPIAAQLTIEAKGVSLGSMREGVYTLARSAMLACINREFESIKETKDLEVRLNRSLEACKIEVTQTVFPKIAEINIKSAIDQAFPTGPRGAQLLVEFKTKHFDPVLKDFKAKMDRAANQARQGQEAVPSTDRLSFEAENALISSAFSHVARAKLAELFPSRKEDFLDNEQSRFDELGPERVAAHRQAKDDIEGLFPSLKDARPGAKDEVAAHLNGIKKSDERDEREQRDAFIQGIQRDLTTQIATRALNVRIIAAGESLDHPNLDANLNDPKLSDKERDEIRAVRAIRAIRDQLINDFEKCRVDVEAIEKKRAEVEDLREAETNPLNQLFNRNPEPFKFPEFDRIAQRTLDQFKIRDCTDELEDKASWQLYELIGRRTLSEKLKGIPNEKQIFDRLIQKHFSPEVKASLYNATSEQKSAIISVAVKDMYHELGPIVIQHKMGDGPQMPADIKPDFKSITFQQNMKGVAADLYGRRAYAGFESCTQGIKTSDIKDIADVKKLMNPCIRDYALKNVEDLLTQFYVTRIEAAMMSYRISDKSLVAALTIGVRKDLQQCLGGIEEDVESDDFAARIAQCGERVGVQFATRISKVIAERSPVFSNQNPLAVIDPNPDRRSDRAKKLDTLIAALAKAWHFDPDKTGTEVEKVRLAIGLPGVTLKKYSNDLPLKLDVSKAVQDSDLTRLLVKSGVQAALKEKLIAQLGKNKRPEDKAGLYMQNAIAELTSNDAVDKLLNRSLNRDPEEDKKMGIRPGGTLIDYVIAKLDDPSFKPEKDPFVEQKVKELLMHPRGKGSFRQLAFKAIVMPVFEQNIRETAEASFLGIPKLYFAQTFGGSLISGLFGDGFTPRNLTQTEWTNFNTVTQDVRVVVKYWPPGLKRTRDSTMSAQEYFEKALLEPIVRGDTITKAEEKRRSDELERLITKAALDAPVKDR
jgi:hypothetical protein